MRLFGFEITRAKALNLVHSNPTGGWFGAIRESYSGAFAQNVTIDSPKDILSFTGVFAPLTLIAADISKLRPKLVVEDEAGICTEVTNSPFLTVLKKPNHYQTRIKFFEQWTLSKLLYGNTYALKERDARGMVNALYILNAERVKPLVADDGGVYYELSADFLSGLQKTITVPASEIIHDMMVSLWHPLVGVSPLYACGGAATMGRRIQSNSSKFFDNMSRPSGVLTAPGTITEETANRIKSLWETNFTGSNIGRLAILGDGLKYEPMTIPAQQAQLAEQFTLTVNDCAAAFHVPLFKVGGPIPVGSTIEALQQVYYTDCLQAIIESTELCLDEGLGLPERYYVELDLDGLLRMDSAAQVKMLAEAVGAGVMAPDEARAKRNLAAVPGGANPYLQQQNYSLEALAKRDALADPFGTAKPEPKPTPEAANDDEMDDEMAASVAELFVKGLKHAA